MAGCLLEKIDTIDGIDYDCGYENAPECDYCMYGPASIHGGVAINPETGRKCKIPRRINENSATFLMTK